MNDESILNILAGAFVLAFLTITLWLNRKASVKIAEIRGCLFLFGLFIVFVLWGWLAFGDMIYQFDIASDTHDCSRFCGH